MKVVKEADREDGLLWRYKSRSKGRNGNVNEKEGRDSKKQRSY